MTMAAASSDTGIVTAGIRVARSVPRNTKITTSTISRVSSSTLPTLRIDSSTNEVKSRLTSASMSGGSVLRRRSSSARTPLDTSRMLALEVGMTPMLTLGRPLERASVRSCSAARRTCATSPRRTR